ncbi:MAG TPA: hypothetical protein PLF23_12040, partial [Candidatus Obscuribacter sp.]|nr:hypothetical protein [Candidatus Obscuribacter sp.]
MKKHAELLEERWDKLSMHDRSFLPTVTLLRGTTHRRVDRKLPEQYSSFASRASGAWLRYIFQASTA